MKKWASRRLGALPVVVALVALGACSGGGDGESSSTSAGATSQPVESTVSTTAYVSIVPTGRLTEVPSARVLHAEVASMIGCGPYSDSSQEGFGADLGECPVLDHENSMAKLNVYPDVDSRISSEREWKPACFEVSTDDDLDPADPEYAVTYDNWSMGRLSASAVVALLEKVDASAYHCDVERLGPIQLD